MATYNRISSAAANLDSFAIAASLAKMVIDALRQDNLAAIPSYDAGRQALAVCIEFGLLGGDYAEEAFIAFDVLDGLFAEEAEDEPADIFVFPDEDEPADNPADIELMLAGIIVLDW